MTQEKVLEILIIVLTSVGIIALICIGVALLALTNFIFWSGVLVPIAKKYKMDRTILQSNQEAAKLRYDNGRLILENEVLKKENYKAKAAQKRLDDQNKELEKSNDELEKQKAKKSKKNNQKTKENQEPKS